MATKPTVTLSLRAFATSVEINWSVNWIDGTSPFSIVINSPSTSPTRTLLNQTTDTPTSGKIIDSGLTPGTTYSYRITASAYYSFIADIGSATTTASATTANNIKGRGASSWDTVGKVVKVRTASNTWTEGRAYVWNGSTWV